MADDFVKTAQQMMKAAQVLQTAGAHRNACYLAGYVVECTLKTMLEAAGQSPWGHEINSLNGLLCGLSVVPGDVIARHGDPTLLAPTMFRVVSRVVKATKPDGTVTWKERCHWDPEHRYDGTRWANDTVSQDYVDEAQKFIDILNDMKIQGVI